MPDIKVANKPNFLFVTNRDLNQQVSALAQEIQSSYDHGELDYIVCINRGGMYVARLLSDLLTLPVLAIGVRSYKGPNDQDELELFQDLQTNLTGKKILLVDEICDTGVTFEFVKKHLIKKGASEVISCCLYIKPHSTFSPEYQGKKTTDWVVFPYEIRETYEAIEHLLTDNKELQVKIGKYLQSVGIDKASFKAKYCP